MSAPSSLTESPLHAEVESPCHAFTANGGGPVEFWRVSARGLSTVPALCKYSCSQASGDDLTDVQNYFNYVLSHTWDFHYNSGASEYKQEDAIDGDTFAATSATALIDTDNFNGGLAPVWNNLTGYLVDPALATTSGADWDKTATRAGIIAALDAVDWSALWAGSGTENSEFEYDRVSIAGDQSGRLPFGGSASGALLGFPGHFGPNKVLTGIVGSLDAGGIGGRAISDDVGVSLSRTQLQVRNYPGTPIPYFIYEQANASSGVALLGGSSIRQPAYLFLNDNANFYRKLSEGNWDHDGQIIQLPDPAMDGPQIISTTFGDRVRNGTYISMVVGMTFEDWMTSILGPGYADFLF